MTTPKIDEMKLVNIIHHKKHGSAMFVKNNSYQINANTRSRGHGSINN